MSGTWRIVIELWAFHGRKPEEIGDKRREFLVQAGSAREAFSMAELIQRGCKTNPAVWEAPIRSVEFVS